MSPFPLHARQLLRFLRSGLLPGFFLTLPQPAAAPAGADPVLMGIPYGSRAEVEALVAPEEVTLRYVTPSVAVVSTSDPSRLEGRPILFRDRAGAGEGYFMTDDLHGRELPRHLRLIYRDPAGWALLRLPETELIRAIDEGHFLFPLPDTYDLRPARSLAGRPLQRRPSPTVAALLATIDPDRLRRHVERLTLHEPALGGVAGNVRTRHARRPETFASTIYLQQQFAAALPAGRVWLDTFRIAAGDSLMYNVIAELPGTDPEAGYYVVGGHYDAMASRTRASQMAAIGESDPAWRWDEHPAPGADDNGSGVALVLETARALAKMPPPPWSVRFIAWSGEELGLWGSKRYAEVARDEDDHILGVFVYDMIGFNDLADRIELVSNPASTWLVDHLRATNERYGIGLQIDILEDSFAGLSDHSPFWARGYDAILGIENYLPTDSSHVAVLRGDYRVNSQYHTVVDLPDSINWELVAAVTRLSVAGLAQFGQESGQPNLAVFTGDLRSVDDDLRVQVTNLGPVDVAEPFGLRLSRCAADSTDCTIVYDEPVPGGLPAGATAQIDIPWQRYGDTVFRIEVDAENLIAESDDEDNTVVQQVRLVPATRIVIYPNPFRIGAQDHLLFSGLPLFSRVQVMSLDGERVWEGREENQGGLSREVRWDGVNDGGFAVGSGVYIYTVRSFEGEMIQRGKIAVVR